MKVKDLIKALQQADPEAVVVNWHWNNGKERWTHVQPTLDPCRFKGLFSIMSDMTYRGKVELTEEFKNRKA